MEFRIGPLEVIIWNELVEAFHWESLSSTAKVIIFPAMAIAAFGNVALHVVIRNICEWCLSVLGIRLDAVNHSGMSTSTIQIIVTDNVNEVIWHMIEDAYGWKTL